MGGKVLVPTSEAISKLAAARLAADVCNVPTLLVARTDAESATLLTSDFDERDRPFIRPGERSSEGFFHVNAGLEQAVARGLAYAPYADLIWCETGKPDLVEARHFAEGIHRRFPGKLLAYNCSPSFNWKAKLDDATIANFQRELGAIGFKFQFITLAGFHDAISQQRMVHSRIRTRHLLPGCRSRPYAVVDGGVFEVGVACAERIGRSLTFAI